MEKINGIFIVGCVILTCACIYIYSNRREAEEKFSEEVPEALKNNMRNAGRIKLTENHIKQCTRFSWLKLLIVDVLVFVGCMFTTMSSEVNEKTIRDGIILAIIMIVLVDLIAFSVDIIKYIKITKMKDRLYSVPIYVHNILNGHAYISYYNHDQYSMELKQIHFGEDDLILLRTMYNGYIPAVFEVKDSVMKFIMVYRTKKVEK